MSLRLLKVEGGNQQQHQQGIEDEAVDEVDEGAVVGGMIGFQYEIRNQDEDESEELYCESKEHIFSLPEECEDQSDRKEVVEDESDGTVDDKITDVGRWQA